MQAEPKKTTVLNRPKRSFESPSFKSLFFKKPRRGTKAARLVALWEKGENSLDRTSSLLMERFTQRGDMESFSALYQLNFKYFLNLINRKLVGFHSRINPTDLLQDVFLLIYRYPRNFRRENDRSFGKWSYSIINNSIRNHLKKLRTREINIDFVGEALPDPGHKGPLNDLIVSEKIDELRRLYSLYLMLYINSYRTCLNRREMTALRLVEVNRLPYKEVARKLDLNYNNLKMIICRARKKISKGIDAIIERTANLRREVSRMPMNHAMVN